jgi:hypothetical protein
VGTVVVLAGIALFLTLGRAEPQTRTDGPGGPDGPSIPQPTPAQPGLLQPSPVAGPGEPTPTPTDTGPPSGETIVLGDGVVSISVPPDWQSELDADVTILVLDDGDGDFMYFRVFAPGVGADAAEEVADFADDTLVGDYGYSRVAREEPPRSFEPDGAILSAASLSYEALWTGGQGAAAVEGVFILLVRDDGAGLAIVIETPGDQYQARQDRHYPVFESAYLSFRDG